MRTLREIKVESFNKYLTIGRQCRCYGIDCADMDKDELLAVLGIASEHQRFIRELKVSSEAISRICEDT